MLRALLALGAATLAGTTPGPPPAAAEGSDALAPELHGEYSKAVVQLFARRAGLRRSVPPQVLRPFVEAARGGQPAFDELDDEAWAEWRGLLREELRAVAAEMAAPTPAPAGLDKQRPAAAVYAEESLPPDDTLPQAELVKDYAGLMAFLRSDRFQRRYFERQPLLLTTRPEQLRAVNAPPSEAAASSQSPPLLNFTFGLADVLDSGDFIYGMAPTWFHHRTVSAAQGGFHRQSKKHQPFDRLTPADIRKALQSGSTVFFDGTQGWSSKVAGLSAELSDALSHFTGVNMYITAGGVSKSMCAPAS